MQHSTYTLHTQRLLRWASLLVALAVTLWAGQAKAWIEKTVLSDNLRVELHRDGNALVSHELLLRVKGGPLKTFTLMGVDKDAELEGAALVTRQGDAADVAPTDVEVVSLPEGGLKFHVMNGKGLYRGRYVFKFAYRTNFLANGVLHRDGAMTRMRWLGPTFGNGIDTAKATFVFSSAPTEPRAASDRPADGALDSEAAPSGAGTFLTTLRRFPNFDELELVRPHVAKGEQVAWCARFDPKAIGQVHDPKVLPTHSAEVIAHVQSSQREKQVFLAVSLGVALLFCALSALKIRQVELHAERLNVQVPGLVGLSRGWRIFLTGPVVAGGLALQLFVDPPWYGTCLLVVAMALMAHRSPQHRSAPRGPGRWLAISTKEAFATPERPAHTWLDISTRSGKVGFFLACLLLAGVVFATHLVSPYHAQLAAIDGLVLLALFCTGRISEMDASLVTGPAPLLQRVAKGLRKLDKAQKVVPWARFADGAEEADELRLLVMPARPMAGLHSIELGVARAAGAGGILNCPQVLVRVTDESKAAEVAHGLAPLGHWVKGRKAGEKVLCLEPRMPHWRLAMQLVQRLSDALRQPSPASSAGAVGKSARSSRGRGASTRKAGKRLEPFQVTEAACSA